MFFSHKARPRLRIALGAILALACLSGLAAALLPREGMRFGLSFIWWLAAIPAGLLACAALELSGNWILGFSFWQRMPAWARILLLVVIIVAIAGAVAFARSSATSSFPFPR